MHAHRTRCIDAHAHKRKKRRRHNWNIKTLYSYRPTTVYEEELFSRRLSEHRVASLYIHCLVLACALVLKNMRYIHDRLIRGGSQQSEEKNIYI